MNDKKTNEVDGVAHVDRRSFLGLGVKGSIALAYGLVAEHVVGSQAALAAPAASDQVELLHGLNGALYAIPESILTTYRVSDGVANKVRQEIKLDTQMSKKTDSQITISGKKAKQLGLLASDETTVVTTP